MANCNSCSSKDTCKTKDKEGCQVISTHPSNKIKHIIGVMSGKGGVGKSTIAVNLANTLAELGYRCGILDADITGPSIPRLLGIEKERATMIQEGIVPVTMKNGLKVISLNLLLEQEESPVIWRGPMISGTVKQFYTDVLWGELDYMIIDMPPGTGDVTLTVMQSLPLKGVVMVTMPQDLISMIVTKAITMARRMNIEVLGIVENMSYMKCPCCEERIRVFERSEEVDLLTKQNVEMLAELPINQKLMDLRLSEREDNHRLEELAKKIISKIQ